MQLSFWFFAVRRFTLYGFQTLQAFVSLGALLAFNQAVHATLGLPGTLDSSWSTSSPSGAGKVVTPVGLMDDVAAAVLVQPDGKIVVTGSCYNNRYTSHSADFCASRYNADGTLDATFNASGSTPGTVITAFGANDSYAKAAALQPDGKIVLGGYCHNGVPALCALRYNANGTLDTSFNVAGSQPGTLTPDFQSYYTYAYGFAASAVLFRQTARSFWPAIAVTMATIDIRSARRVSTRTARWIPLSIPRAIRWASSSWTSEESFRFMVRPRCSRLTARSYWPEIAMISGALPA